MRESKEYRALRDQLLEAEIALREERERVAPLRRQLPMEALVETDYVFREGPADVRDDSPANFRDVRLSELCASGKNLQIVDHMMRAANGTLPCRMCNMWADGYNAVALHVSDKVNFVLVAKVENRGIDLFTPVWNLFDLLPEGREMWMPKHFCNAASSAARPGI